MLFMVSMARNDAIIQNPPDPGQIPSVWGLPGTLHVTDCSRLQCTLFECTFHNGFRFIWLNDAYAVLISTNENSGINNTDAADRIPPQFRRKSKYADGKTYFFEYQKDCYESFIFRKKRCA